MAHLRTVEPTRLKWGRNPVQDGGFCISTLYQAQCWAVGRSAYARATLFYYALDQIRDLIGEK